MMEPHHALAVPPPAVGWPGITIDHRDLVPAPRQADTPARGPASPPFNKNGEDSQPPDTRRVLAEAVTTSNENEAMT